jgi:hypothetical protein
LGLQYTRLGHSLVSTVWPLILCTNSCLNFKGLCGSTSSSFGTTLCGFSRSQPSLQVHLPLAASFQFLTFSLFRSFMTSSCHRCLGLPTGQVPIGFQSNSFLLDFAWYVLWICPSCLILCALMNITISAPSIKLSISMLFHILHTLSILTGPNIFPNICRSTGSHNFTLPVMA